VILHARTGNGTVFPGKNSSVGQTSPERIPFRTTFVPSRIRRPPSATAPHPQPHRPVSVRNWPTVDGSEPRGRVRTLAAPREHIPRGDRSSLTGGTAQRGTAGNASTGVPTLRTGSDRSAGCPARPGPERQPGPDRQCSVREGGTIRLRDRPTVPTSVTTIGHDGVRDGPWNGQARSVGVADPSRCTAVQTMARVRRRIGRYRSSKMDADWSTSLAFTPKNRTGSPRCHRRLSRRSPPQRYGPAGPRPIGPRRS